MLCLRVGFELGLFNKVRLLRLWETGCILSYKQDVRVGVLAQLVKSLSDKQVRQSLVPRTHATNKQSAEYGHMHLHFQCWRSRNGQILGAYWPASLTYLTSSRPLRPQLKTQKPKVMALRDNKGEYPQLPHKCALTHALIQLKEKDGYEPLGNQM